MAEDEDVQGTRAAILIGEEVFDMFCELVEVMPEHQRYPTAMTAMSAMLVAFTNHVQKSGSDPHVVIDGISASAHRCFTAPPEDVEVRVAALKTRPVSPGPSPWSNVR